MVNHQSLRTPPRFRCPGFSVADMARILVIDDDPTIRGLMKLSLTSDGHEVEVAEDGGEGLRLMAQGTIDVAIVDLYMPGKEGIETIAGIRKLFFGLPVIAMSGMDLADEMLSVARLLGVKATLKKPFTIEELREAVAKALRV